MSALVASALGKHFVRGKHSECPHPGEVKPFLVTVEGHFLRRLVCLCVIAIAAALGIWWSLRFDTGSDAGIAQLELVYEFPQPVLHRRKLLAVSGSGDLAVLGESPFSSTPNLVWLFDVKTRDFMPTKIEVGRAEAAVFLPIGNSVAVASRQQLALFDLGSKREIWKTSALPIAGDPVMECTPDAKLLFCSSASKSILVIDAVTGKQLAELAGHSADITALRHVAGNLLSFGLDATGIVWDLSSFRQMKTIRIDGGNVSACAPAARQNGDAMVYGTAWGRAGTVILQDTKSGAVHGKMTIDEPVYQADVSSDGKYVVYGTFMSTGQNHVGLLTGKDLKPMARAALGKACVTKLTFLGPDTFIGQTNDGTIRIWRIRGDVSTQSAS